MQFSLKPSTPTSVTCDCLIIPIFDEKKNGSIVNQINEASDNLIKTVIKGGDFKPDLGSTLLLQRPVGIKPKRLLLLGLGKKNELNYKKWGTAMTKATSIAAKIPTLCL